jgi:YhcH/YjgK/YiaL family protein
MIFDSIENIKLYVGIKPLIDQAIYFLIENNLDNMPEQRIGIQGEDLYLMIQHYDSEKIFGRSYEAHNNYIDIQYIISGAESIIYSNRKHLTVEKQYDDETDVALYRYDSDVVPMKLNLGCADFAVFFPEDAHMPKLQTEGGPVAVKKAVLKIRVQ